MTKSDFKGRNRQDLIAFDPRPQTNLKQNRAE